MQICVTKPVSGHKGRYGGSFYVSVAGLCCPVACLNTGLDIETFKNVINIEINRSWENKLLCVMYNPHVFSLMQ